MKKQVKEIFLFPEHIRNLPEADISIKGVKAYLSQSDDHQILFMQFTEDVELPEHAHGAQAGFVLEGRIDLVVEGERRTYIKGDRYFIPAGAKHSVKVYKGYADVTFFAEPARYSVAKRKERLNLRPITPEDVAQIKKWPAYAGEFEQLDYALREKGWLDEFKNRPGTWIYAAEMNKKQIVGFSILLAGADGNAEFRIAIHPQRLRTGLGRKITLLTLRKGFDELNLDIIRLIVRETNFPAIKLYESLGFSTIGESIHSIQGKRIEFIDMEMTKQIFERRS